MPAQLPENGTQAVVDLYVGVEIDQLLEAVGVKQEVERIWLDGRAQLEQAVLEVEPARVGDLSCSDRMTSKSSSAGSKYFSG